jgi:hypothetical protein
MIQQTNLKDTYLKNPLVSLEMPFLLITYGTVNSFNFVGTNFRGLGKKDISWDS